MANRYDTNQKLQEIADNLGQNSGLIDALEDIKTAIDNGGGGGGGTTVIANPSGQPTDTLNTIQIGSTVYDIDGGSVELDLVPRLTSNTIAGIGTASDNDALSPAWLPWHAFATETEFDASVNGGYWATTSANGYLEFTFDNPVTIKSIAFGVYNTCTFLVQYSSDGTTFTDGQTISRTGPDSGYICHNEKTTLSQPIDCIAIRLKATSASSHNLGAVHFYGTWQDTLSADDVDYDNTNSGLTATNVQDAIDEIDTNVDTLNSNTVKFIDTSTLLTTLSTQNASYLATVDCVATGYMANTTGDATLSIDGVEVMRTGVPTGVASGYLNAVYLPIKKGQTIATRATFGTYNIKIYAMQ